MVFDKQRPNALLARIRIYRFRATKEIGGSRVALHPVRFAMFTAALQDGQGNALCPRVPIRSCTWRLEVLASCSGGLGRRAHS
jgi:hypothetical protein